MQSVALPLMGLYPVPAIAAGTVHRRSFTRRDTRLRYIKKLQLYNRSATTIIVTVGDGRSQPATRVAPGDAFLVDDGTQIEWYTIDSVANTNANEVDAYEAGGCEGDDEPGGQDA